MPPLPADKENVEAGPEGVPMVLVQMPMCNGTDTWGSGRSLNVLCTDGSAGASDAFAVLVADMLEGCGCGCEILGGGVAAGALGFVCEARRGEQSLKGARERRRRRRLRSRR